MRKEEKIIKKKKNNNKFSGIAPFIIASVAILLILCTSKVNLIFDIIKMYMKGEIYVTYDDFPDISEWIQIVSTVLFSYLLWKATCETNKLNNNNLKLQERIKKEEDLLRFIKVYDDVSYLYNKVESTCNVQKVSLEMGTDREHMTILYKDISITDWTKQYFRVLYSKNEEMICQIEKVIKMVDEIKTFYGIANDAIGMKEITPPKIFQDQINNYSDFLFKKSNELLIAIKAIKIKMDEDKSY